MSEEKKNVIDSRCGLHCTGCAYKEPCSCGGCIETNGHPFHGECPVAMCCQEKGIVHCGECAEIPCELLTQYSCDPEHGDKPCGARIEQCRKWYAEFGRRDVYEACPVFEDVRYRIRLLTREDAADLLKVYSDEKAIPFFNSDNCGGDDFRYGTEERMRQAVEYWLWEYGRRGFVRWSVVDKRTEEAVGTMELFRREADDASDGCGILRLDLRSDYEVEGEIFDLLGRIVPPAYGLFGCRQILTKAIPAAVERRRALEKFGFIPWENRLVGHDWTEYGDYFVKEI